MEDKYIFEKLTPINNADIKVYEDALHFAFNSTDIKNIAITGAYGSGKSSVLETYKNKTKKKLLHISLAHFINNGNSKKYDGKILEKNEHTLKAKTEDNNTSEQKKDTEYEESLEGKILNQLIYQIPIKNIPKTNFKIKKNNDEFKISEATFFLVIAILIACYFVLFDRIKEFLFSIEIKWLKELLLGFTNNHFILFMCLILVSLGVFTIYNLVKMQYNNNLLKRLNINGNSIELFEKEDDSTFDKYLNEILYLLEKCDAEAIVFEDIDRYNSALIFERLREINTLANAKPKKGETSNKSIKFIYLLRDDVFVSKDRTKFFDFILPIIPVVDSSNSYDIIIEHLQKNGISYSFDRTFLQDISLYIDDMRIIKNICNEFLVYYKRLNTIELDCDKMFALITYKNIFPKDFSELQLGRGFIYSIIANKESYIADEISELKRKIDELKQKIESAKNEPLKTINELNLVYEPQKVYSGYGSSKKLPDDKQLEYNSRKEDVENKSSEKIIALENEIQQLEQEVILIKNKALKDIISRDNINSIFSIILTNEIGEVTTFDEIRGSEYFSLLKYLVRYGYIDETYADYMTYFYGNSLSLIDKTFLRSVTDQKAKEYSYKLNKPEMVFTRLKTTDFKQEETLNFDLFCYLLNEKIDSEETKSLIYQLSSSNNLDFVKQFFDNTVNWGHYVPMLNICWPSLFDEILKSELFSNSTVHDYSVYSLSKSDNLILDLINVDNCLTEYINNSLEYLNIIEPNVERIINALIHLDVKFKVFDLVNADEKLIKEVYYNSLYELNYTNIEYILLYILGLGSKAKGMIKHNNYSCILQNRFSPLYEYVESNINDYASLMLDKCDGVINDDKDSALTLLNNPDLLLESKIRYISFLKTNINELNNVDDTSLWENCIRRRIVDFTEKNIIDYYRKNEGLDETIISFINDFQKPIDMSSAPFKNDDKKSEFFTAIVCSNLINDEKYQQILVSMKFFYFDGFTLENLPATKMGILLDKKIIVMTAANLKSIRENYPEHVHSYIRKNIHKYSDIMTQDLFSSEELIGILKEKINDDIKLELLAYESKAISIINLYSYLSCDVKKYILENNFEIGDLNFLWNKYSKEEKEIQLFLYEKAVRKIEQVIINASQIDIYLIKKLLDDGDVSENNEIALMCKVIGFGTKEFVCSCFDSIGLYNYKAVFDTSKRPRFDVTRNDDKLLTALKQRGWITDYHQDGNIFRIKRKSSLKEKLKV